MFQILHAGATKESGTLRELRLVSGPLRFRILMRLGKSAASVSEIVAATKGSPTRVSHALKVLREAGVVTSRSSFLGPRIRVYSINR